MKPKPFVKTDKKGKVAAGSLTFSYKKPIVGTWKDVSADAPSTVTSFPPWTVVTGGVAGDGRVFRDDITPDVFTFVGPNDDANTGWVYIKKYCSVETAFSIPYKWASFDSGDAYDRPIYWTSATEPTGVPADTTSKVDTTPDEGTWDIIVPAGQWFAIGIYSTDSCCGRGFLETSISFQPVSSFTLASTEFEVLGGGNTTRNGLLGWTGTGTHPVGAELVNVNTFVGSKLTDIQTFFSDNGLLTDGTAYIFNVTWGAGSSISSGKVMLGCVLSQLLISAVYTGDNNWQIPGQDIYSGGPMAAAGTFNFPATFSLYTPTISNPSNWC